MAKRCVGFGLMAGAVALLLQVSPAAAQTWTLTFPAGTPDTTMRQPGTFQVRVTNTGTQPISYITMPFPAGYSAFSSTRPANWNMQTSGSTLTFLINKF